MTEPRRWLDDGAIDSGLRSALEAATEPPQLPTALHAQLSTYALSLASQSALAKVGGASLGHGFLAGSSGKALVFASLMGLGAMASFGALYALVPLPPGSQAGPTEAPASHAPERAALPRSAPAKAVAPLPVPERRNSATRPQVSTNAGASTGEVARQPPAAASANVASIAAEAQLLERARSLLTDAPARALELTEQHRELEGTQLSAEREFIAIAALLRLGRRAEAERRAAPRLEQAPDSVYARRLRHLLAASTPATANGTNQ